jgi:hypothetical protein
MRALNVLLTCFTLALPEATEQRAASSLEVGRLRGRRFQCLRISVVYVRIFFRPIFLFPLTSWHFAAVGSS